MATVLHIPTLTLCLAATLVIVSVFLTLLWAAERNDRALARWSLGFWVGCFGLCLVSLRDVAPPWLALALGNAASIWSLGLIWLGCLAFENEGRTAAYPMAIAGGVVWLMLFAIPSFADDLPMRLLVASGLYSTYSFLIVYVLWRGHGREPLPARVLAVAAFGLHGLAYVIRIPLQLVEPAHVVDGNAPPWLGIMTFGFVAQGLTGALAIFAMVHERTSRRYKHASEIDFLTSIFNRRAFLAAITTDRAVAGGREEGGILALVDADHFKSINDTYGHAAGDAALVALAGILSDCAPKEAIVGRVGGEEFGIYLPPEVASADADILHRLRRAVREKAIGYGHCELRLTVSIGAVVLPEGQFELSAALAAADRALYASKRAGRDCLSFAALEQSVSTAQIQAHGSESGIEIGMSPRSAA